MTEQVDFDLLYLCGCALRRELPDDKRCCNMDMEQLYMESQRQSLGALTYFALSQWSGFQSLPEQVQQSWKALMMQSVRKAMMMNAEREMIFDWMEENQIWHMPLKGSVLQEYYPELGMREMSDNDVLIDPAARQKIHDFMVNEMEYTVYEYSPVESYDDVYHKEPLYSFEMHKRLFEEDTPLHEAYYANIAEKLIPDADGQYGRHLSDEDFYLYILAHAHRHYEASGMGLRLLVDCYVWNQAKRAGMNLDYLKKELEKLELTEFEAACYGLSEKLIGGQDIPLNANEKEMFSYMIRCGLFGNEEIGSENRVIKQMKKENVDAETAKRQLFLKRLFPDLHYYEIRVPFVYRHKVLIPFYWLYRLIRKILIGGIVKEVKQLKNTHIDME